MKNDDRLLNLMIAHHGLIEVLLATFRDSLSDSEKAREVFDDFKWQIEKHFFVEENINFRFVFANREDLYKVVQRLLEEHKEMLRMMDEIEQQLQNKMKIESDALMNLLQTHAGIEENILYPKMEEFLTQYQIDLIMERINEIVLKK